MPKQVNHYREGMRIAVVAPGEIRRSVAVHIPWSICRAAGPEPWRRAVRFRARITSSAERRQQPVRTGQSWETEPPANDGGKQVSLD